MNRELLERVRDEAVRELTAEVGAEVGVGRRHMYRQLLACVDYFLLDRGMGVKPDVSEAMSKITRVAERTLSGYLFDGPDKVGVTLRLGLPVKPLSSDIEFFRLDWVAVEQAAIRAREGMELAEDLKIAELIRDTFSCVECGCASYQPNERCEYHFSRADLNRKSPPPLRKSLPLVCISCGKKGERKHPVWNKLSGHIGYTCGDPKCSEHHAGG